MESIYLMFTLSPPDTDYQHAARTQVKYESHVLTISEIKRVS